MHQELLMQQPHNYTLTKIFFFRNNIKSNDMHYESRLGKEEKNM